MIVVGNSIVSDEVADCRFGCDLMHCKGACCVEGDSGAPLLDAEVEQLQSILEAVRPYMSEAGLSAVEQQGVAVRDAEGDLGTPLIDGGECAYAVHNADGTVLCAIEKAYREGRIKGNYCKPLSCHLYPIRIDDYGEFTAVNYHRWDICRHAAGCGQPLYVGLREPLIRRFGQQWYEELLDQIKQRKHDE
ncbi:MAG: DUF3109 family protein [Bacteroidales bacterium]|nr:DUF3109 family protein [Bacteroidales bacterium]